MKYEKAVRRIKKSNQEGLIMKKNLLLYLFDCITLICPYFAVVGKWAQFVKLNGKAVC